MVEAAVQDPPAGGTTTLTDPPKPGGGSSASTDTTGAAALAQTVAADKARDDAAAAAAQAARTPEQKAADEKAAAEKKTADDKKAADDKAAAEKAQRERVYTLKLPDKSVLDASVTERTTAIARELGLSTDDAAQKVLDFTSQEVARTLEATVQSHQPGGAEWQKQVDTWGKESLAAADLGNGSQETLTAVATKAKAVIEKYAPPGVKEFLHTTGYGSNPDVIRFFANIAKASSDGSLVTGQGGAARQEKSAADTIYGGEKKT